MTQRQRRAALTGALNRKMETNIKKQWLLIKVKLTEFTFKTGNRRGYYNVIRSGLYHQGAIQVL